MRHFKCFPTCTYVRKAIFISSQLTSCSYLFIHNVQVTLFLQPIYLGSFLLKQREYKYFDIYIIVTIKRIFIYRLKTLLSFERLNGHATVNRCHHIVTPCYLIWQSTYSAYNFKRYYTGRRVDISEQIKRLWTLIVFTGRGV